ncbi:MAG: ABC transporter ATP-binding protein [Planctomycetaceae bacterium]
MTDPLQIKNKRAVVQADRAGKVFPSGFEAVRDVSVKIHEQEFVSIVGPSGCGKSTFLKMIAGLMEPSSGSVSVTYDGPSESSPKTGKTSFVFQDPALLPWRTVAGNVGLPLELAGLPFSERRQAIENHLKLVGLQSGDAKKFPRMLSGGMRMRVSLARALVTKPRLLLLDEPFGALDDLLRQQLNSELLRLWSEQKWTAVFITHNVSEAVFLSHRVLVMSESPGTLVADIPVPFSFPRSSELRADADFARLIGEVARYLRHNPVVHSETTPT